jgi:hypothetical protein
VFSGINRLIPRGTNPLGTDYNLRFASLLQAIGETIATGRTQQQHRLHRLVMR